jgi:starch synthase
LDWDNTINPLAAAIKSCDALTTVSEGYLEELKAPSNPLQWLYNEFHWKSKGIVNGIDNEVWNPKTDETLATKFTGNWTDFKLENKKEICASVGLNPALPLVVFIGRLNVEKGGEILTQAIGRYASYNRSMNFYILGSGANSIEDNIRHLTGNFQQNIANYIGYNETLAHQLYAAADFILMPSLVEPCGLNQLYAMRYATIPMVRSVGGLKDTVIDFGDENGYGIRFNEATADDIIYSFDRASALYANTKMFAKVRKTCVGLDFSWDKAIKKYIELYKN